MANVFGNSNSRSCSSSGGILSAPKTTVVPARQTSSSPNVFRGDSAAPEQVNPRDFYTRREIDKYLDDKADLSSVYLKTETYSASEIDQRFFSLNLSSYASIAYVDQSISSQIAAINSDLGDNYYSKSQSYSKAEVDSLVSSASVGDSYVSKSPDSLEDITIVPSDPTLPVSLVVRSSNNDSTTLIQKWENSSTDLLAAIYADGQANFSKLVTIGENVNVGEVSINASERRVGGVADPINNLDAVNKSYMETWVTGAIEDITQNGNQNYLIDALEY